MLVLWKFKSKVDFFFHILVLKSTNSTFLQPELQVCCSSGEPWYRGGRGNSHSSLHIKIHKNLTAAGSKLALLSSSSGAQCSIFFLTQSFFNKYLSVTQSFCCTWRHLHKHHRVGSSSLQLHCKHKGISCIFFLIKNMQNVNLSHTAEIHACYKTRSNSSARNVESPIYSATQCRGTSLLSAAKHMQEIAVCTCTYESTLWHHFVIYMK